MDLAVHLHHNSRFTSPTLALIVRRFGRIRLWQTAFQLLFETRRAMLEIDSGPYVAAADASRAVERWGSALSVLSRARQDGLGQIANVSNAVSSAVFRSTSDGWPRVLHLLLDMLACSRWCGFLQADQISFGTAISACSRSLQWHAATKVLHLMRGWKLFPDSVPLVSAAASCNRAPAKTGAWCWSLHWSAWVSQARQAPSLMLHNCAISAASRGANSGNWAGAVQQLDRLQRSRLQADRVSLSAVLAACQRAAAAEPALRMLAQLPGTRLRACAICHSSVIMACAARLKWQEGAALLPFLKKSFDTRQAFLGSVVKAAYWRESLRLFSFSHLPGRRPRLIRRADLQPALQACCASDQYWSAREILRDARARGWRVTVQEQSVAVQSCKAQDAWPHALLMHLVWVWTSHVCPSAKWTKGLSHVSI